MRRAVCPGSFDPIHNGHLEVIARAASLFDEVIVAVSTNYAKKYRFTLEERIEMAKETLASLRGIVVEPVGEGLLAEYCRQRGVSAIVKGLRSSSDFDYELPMATMNRQLSGVETVFLPAEAHYLHLSSTLIKEVFTLGGNVAEYVPRSVLKRLVAGGPAPGQPSRG
ncbi:Phosphopantetheine adenylyltransferase [Arthrobacter sp. Bi83]|jgi:pantetheine-phosphate adenylyltransferase|uniref:pantetheine-phosphate adenylyltransferase n=1 Tax=Arthrobacter sp. Bi83 TaxID=2822353 RepID=UPI001DA5CCF5|nr:pantetheine-phosphate adenylyltransferase [Arthrobacter sp. Bi83]CAH0135620.1 Phosphopantetheine adenylyltransferase [Arthrobacter sp. Bi83]